MAFGSLQEGVLEHFNPKGYGFGAVDFQVDEEGRGLVDACTGVGIGGPQGQGPPKFWPQGQGSPKFWPQGSAPPPLNFGHRARAPLNFGHRAQAPPKFWGYSVEDCWKHASTAKLNVGYA